MDRRKYRRQRKREGAGLRRAVTGADHSTASLRLLPAFALAFLALSPVRAATPTPTTTPTHTATDTPTRTPTQTPTRAPTPVPAEVLRRAVQAASAAGGVAAGFQVDLLVPVRVFDTAAPPACQVLSAAAGNHTVAAAWVSSPPAPRLHRRLRVILHPDFARALGQGRIEMVRGTTLVCNFSIKAGARPGMYRIRADGAAASDAQGNAVPVVADDNAPGQVLTNCTGCL